MNRILYVFIYAVTDLIPFRVGGETVRERLSSLWATSKRWLTTALNVFTLTTLIVAALVIGGLVIGTTRLIREYIEANPLALVVEIHGGIGASVKTISEVDEKDIRTFSNVGDRIEPKPDSDVENQVVYFVAGWNDYDIWFWKRDGSRDSDFTPGRTIKPEDPLLEKLKFTVRASSGPLFSQSGVPEIVVTQNLLTQLGYDSTPETVLVSYRDKAAPLKVIGVTGWIPSGDFLISESFYRRLRDKQWVWPPMHRHAYLGPLQPKNGEEILQNAKNYFRDQNVKASIQERAGSAKWLQVKIAGKENWPQDYWKETFFPTIALYLNSPQWLQSLSVDFDEPLPSNDDTWSTVDIGYTRGSVYVKQLSFIPGVVDALERKGIGVDDRIAQEVVFLQQISAFGKRLFAWVIGAVATMAAVNIGLSFAQTIHRKQAQIGILRAFGASRSFIFSIYICEATMIWMLAAILGLFIAFPAGEGIGKHIMKVWEQKGGQSEMMTSDKNEPKFFYAPTELLITTLGGALLVCCIATATAAAKAANVNPAIAVRARE